MAAVMDSPLLRERELVQELGKEPLPKFFQKETIAGIAEGTLRLVDVPIIDISILNTSKAEVEKLGSALKSFGCCMGINHGMSTELTDRLREASVEFFEQSLEEKMKCVRPEVHWEGYGFDQFPEDYGAHDWSDRVMILVRPEKERQYQYWPQKPDDFKELMHEFSIKTTELNVVVLKAMARILGLENEDVFLEEMGDPTIFSRLNLYPPCSRPDKVLGINEHTDGSVLTFLFQDKEVEGFQLLKDGEWVRVGVKPTDAVLIKIGDQGEIMSNGLFKAPLHRGALNKDRTRNSVAFFTLPDPDKDFGPVKEVVSEKRPAQYKTVKNYAMNHLKVANHRDLIDSTKL
ncbi:Flavonol synthase/flavanone 3-hydroxylase [Linum grandiflorum]